MKPNRFMFEYFDVDDDCIYVWTGDGENDMDAISNVAKGKGYWIKVIEGTPVFGSKKVTEIFARKKQFVQNKTDLCRQE